MAADGRLIQQHIQTVTPYDTAKEAVLVQQHVQVVSRDLVDNRNFSLQAYDIIVVRGAYKDDGYIVDGITAVYDDGEVTDAVETIEDEGAL